MELIFASNKDVCPQCEQYIYKKDVRLWVPEARTYGIVHAYECLCGTWVMDRYGRRIEMDTAYIDPERINNLREIEEELKGSADVNEALKRLQTMYEED